MFEQESKSGIERAEFYDKPHRAGYEALANVIVVRAAEDYRAALRTLRDPEPEEQTYANISQRNHAERAKVEIEVFFRSRWFGMLTGVSGRYLMRRLRKERPSG